MATEQGYEEQFLSATELSMCLKPVSLHLYWVIPKGKPLAELVIEDMDQRFGSINHQPNTRLLFEEIIIPLVFYQNQ